MKFSKYLNMRDFVMVRVIEVWYQWRYIVPANDHLHRVQSSRGIEKKKEKKKEEEQTIIKQNGTFNITEQRRIVTHYKNTPIQIYWKFYN